MADYEIIKPKVDLRKKIRILPSSPDFDPVAKAEEALERLSTNFGDWMKEEVAKLQATWTTIGDSELDEEKVTLIFRSAHDIKGQAHTMGFPIAGMIAGSLCDLIEKVPTENLPKELLLKHVQAITAVVNEDAREEDNLVGKELATELANRAGEIVEEFGLEKEKDIHLPPK